MRLFVSLTPPAHVLEHLDDALDSVRALLPAEPGNSRPTLRWVAQEQRHITLAFFGELPSGAVDELQDTLTLSLAEHSALSLRLRGAGVFSGRTLWAGVQDQVPATHSRRNGPLADLMAACEAAGRSVGSTIERHQRRRAHLTLARVRSRVSTHGGRRRPRRDPAGTIDRTRGASPTRQRTDPGNGTEQVRHLADALAVYEGPVWIADAASLMVSELGAGPGGGPQHETLAVLPLTG